MNVNLAKGYCCLVSVWKRIKIENKAFQKPRVSTYVINFAKKTEQKSVVNDFFSYSCELLNEMNKQELIRVKQEATASSFLFGNKLIQNK